MNKFIAVMIFVFLSSCAKDLYVQSTPGLCNEGDSVNTFSKSEGLQELLNKATNSGLAGVSLVLQDSKGAYFYGNAGKADLHSNIDINKCQQFRVASLTKVFTAVGIMMMVEQEKLSLDTPIDQILLPEVLRDIKRANEATVRNLLNHTSGIANYDDNPNFALQILNEPGKRISLMEKLDLIRGQGAVPAEVVERYGSIYSNTNYLLLELILEKISEQEYEDVVRLKILGPLQLDHTVFSTEKPYPANLARGYIDFYDKGVLRDVSEWDAQRFNGEGSIISTSLDIFIFFKSLLEGQLLENKTLAAMEADALGLLKEVYQDELLIGHDGQAIGYSAEMWFLKERELLVVLLANQGRITDDQSSIQSYEKLLTDIIDLAK